MKKALWGILLILLCATAALADEPPEVCFTGETVGYWWDRDTTVAVAPEGSDGLIILDQYAETDVDWDSHHKVSLLAKHAGKYTLVNAENPEEELLSILVADEEEIPEELIGAWEIRTTNQRASKEYDKWKVIFRRDGTGVILYPGSPGKATPSNITYRYGSGIVSIDPWCFYPNLVFEEGRLSFLAESHNPSGEEDIRLDVYTFKKQRMAYIKKISLKKSYTVNIGEMLEVEAKLSPGNATDYILNFIVEGEAEPVYTNINWYKCFLIFSQPGTYTLRALSRDGSEVESNPVEITVVDEKPIPDDLTSTAWSIRMFDAPMNYYLDSVTTGRFYTYLPYEDRAYEGEIMYTYDKNKRGQYVITITFMGGGFFDGMYMSYTVMDNGEDGYALYDSYSGMLERLPYTE